MHHGRFVIGFGHGGRGAPGARGARIRYWRVDKAAGPFLRRDRVQADLWTRQPRQRAAAIVQPRYRRTASGERGGRWPDYGHYRRPDPLDPTTLSAPAWNAKRTRASPKGLRIGVPTRFYVDDLESDIASAVDATIAILRKLGAKMSEVELPDQTVVSAAALIVLAVEATSAHAPWLRTRAADYGPQVRNRLQNGLAYSAVEYLEALRWRGPALAAHLDAIGDVDVVIAPASRSVAPTIVATDLGGTHEAEAAIQAITRFMRPTNFLGLPSLVVPAGQSKSGLPIGMQLIGRPFGDETLIALGRAFQAATNHHRRVPALP